MTPEQARYGGDIIKALELSGANVPPEVLQLWEEYKKQAEAVSIEQSSLKISTIVLQEGKKVKSYSGFHGKGFKFDETEAQLANDRKKLQKAALGLQAS
jgi:ATP-dependent RNA helicase DDX46/PRP5